MRQSRFLFNVNLVFLTYVANYLLAFLLRVLVTRALGADGLGSYTLFLLVISISSAVLGLGVSVSTIYHIGKGTFGLRDVLSNSQSVVLGSLVVSGVLVGLTALTFGDRLDREEVPYWLFAAAVPLFVNFNILTAILQGANRFQAMNLMVLVRPLGMAFLMVAGMAAGGLDLTGVLIFWTVSSFLTMVAGLALVGLRHLHLPTALWPRWAVLKEQVGFGLQGQIGNLLQLLNYRLDSFLVLAFVNTAGVGLYAVGVAVAEGIWFVANAVSVVLLPRLTHADPEDAARLTPVACRNTLLVSLAAAVGAGVLAPVLVEPIFGPDFGPSVTAVYWLLPGTVALAGTKILASYVFSQGKPLVNSYVTLATVATTVLFDLALIPSFGVSGAAAASSIAYGLSLVLSLIVFSRMSGQPAWDAVLVRGSDLRMYVDAARTLRARGALPRELSGLSGSDRSPGL
jgi:O-antigen/teichoic acid export membrane protein